MIQSEKSFIDPDGDAPPRETLHREMTHLAEVLESATPVEPSEFTLFPERSSYHQSLSFYTEIFRDMSADRPDFDRLLRKFRDKIYLIYNELPAHVDPRPDMAIRRLVERFRNLK